MNNPIPLSSRTDFLAGAQAITPIALGVIPFGLIAGVAMVNAGIPPHHAIAMTIVSFTGAAQLAAIDLINRTAPIAVVILTAVIINLRFTMYSASLAPYFQQFDSTMKWIGAYLLTDEAYAVSITKFRGTEWNRQSQKWFYFGAAISFWATWQISAAAGVLLGSSIPAGFSLEFAVPLTFIALLFPALDDRPTEFAALVSGSASVLTAILPLNLGLVTAALIGVAVGVSYEFRRGMFPVTTHVSTTEADVSEGCDAA
ncbi:AzlC family ABC transporter permease [Natrialba sp. PRR66]|uniref:AzlC family ABC transporter permease n=1 Tax=Natrialba sp. PRR66 TaxID=3098146 RepID=UPI002B1D2E5B|nr:AzlC family ABC transporter permease [Natrialba sp. PRR66]